ncbi:MAG TPA: hypothetical protein VIS96_18085 [Terrimicrobiaceae bacterium]
MYIHFEFGKRPPEQAPELPSRTEGQGSLYEALLAHALHQDRLVWDVSQMLIAVQGGVLISGYALRSHWFAVAILLLGAFLTLFLLALVRKHELDRDVNRRLLDSLAESLVPENVKHQLRRTKTSEPIVRISAAAPHSHMRGRFILRTVIFALIAVDIAFAGLIYFAPECLPPVQSK